MIWNIEKMTTDRVTDVKNAQPRDKDTNVCPSLYLTRQQFTFSTLYKDQALEQTAAANASVSPLWQYTSVENGLKGYFAAVSSINKCL